MENFRIWLRHEARDQTEQQQKQNFLASLRRLSFVLEVKSFLSMRTKLTTPGQDKLRCKMSEVIYEKYLNLRNPDSLEIPELLIEKLESEKPRPTSATLQWAWDQQCTILDPVFQQYLQILSGLLKISPEGLLKMSEDALTALLASHAEHISARDQAHFVSRVRPTEEDKNTLEAALRSCSLMPLTFQIVLFYQYLIRCSHQDDLPMLEQNLIFELELVRFQEMCHGKVHNSVLKQKLTCLLLTFLESAIPPQVQVSLEISMELFLVYLLHYWVR
ncbi:unnamed protein product [Dicrocoelium dendriticum]|nr:unnamed protein product [Dicrocoelium dendriticum]